MRENPLANEPGDAAEKNTEGDETGPTPLPARRWLGNRAVLTHPLIVVSQSALSRRRLSLIMVAFGGRLVL